MHWYYVKDQAITGVTKLDANGAVAGTFADVLTGNDAIPTNSTVTGSGFVLDIKKDGKRLDLTADINASDPIGITYSEFFDADNLDVSDGKVVVASHFVDGGNVIYKLPNGNYSFELYVVTNGKIGAIRRANVAVSDSQVTPTFTKKEQSISKAGTAAACFEFKFDGQTQSNIAVASSTTNGYGAYKTFIKTINVTISVAADNGSFTGTYTIPVTVNTLLDK